MTDKKSLAIKRDTGSTMFTISYAGGGPPPKELSGKYLSHSVASQALSVYQGQVAYLEEQIALSKLPTEAEIKEEARKANIKSDKETKAKTSIPEDISL